MTTKEYAIVVNGYYRNHQHDPGNLERPMNYIYQALGFAQIKNSGPWGVFYRALYQKKVHWLPVTDWFQTLPDGKEFYELIYDASANLDTIMHLAKYAESLYGQSWTLMQMDQCVIHVTQKDLSDLTEDEARKICGILDLDFQSFLPRDAADYLPGKQKIKILGDGGYSTTVEIHESGQIIVFYGASEAPALDINTLPIIDYLRSQGYIFKY